MSVDQPLRKLSVIKSEPTKAISPRVRAGNIFVRMCVAHARGFLDKAKASEVAEQLWPEDRVVNELIKAASNPAMTTVPGWAQELAHHMVADMIDAMGPASASGEIFAQSLVVSMAGVSQIAVPHLVITGGTTSGFVPEGQPIPVHQLAVVNPDFIDPHKVATIVVLTREMIESSNAEAMVGDCLSQSAGRMVDEVIFDGNPNAANRPAGLRYNVAVTAASTNTDSQQAFLEDVGKLADAVAPVAGNGPLIWVGSPGRAIKTRVRFNYELPKQIVLGSSAVINDFLCIVPGGLVVAVGSDPVIEVGRATALHMAVPASQIDGASPVRSMFQTDSIAMKVRYPLSWARRDPRAFAWTTPTGW